MKKGVKISLIAVIVAVAVYIVLFLSIKVQPFRASFSGGFYQNVPCVMEITSEGTLTVETGTAALHPENEGLYKDWSFGTAKKRETRKLSIRERWEINKIADKVKKKGLPADRYSYGAADAIMFCVLIDDIEYECIYDHPMGNWRVNDLAYKLVELSPIDILEPRNAFLYLLQRTHGDFMLY